MALYLSGSTTLPVGLQIDVTSLLMCSVYLRTLVAHSARWCCLCIQVVGNSHSQIVASLLRGLNFPFLEVPDLNFRDPMEDDRLWMGKVMMNGTSTTHLASMGNA